ncbi:hypothetical protein YC2023_085060 [Brassica napus]
MLPGDNATPHKGKLSATVGINKFIHRIISLDDVKMVKSAMNMSLQSMTSAVLEMGSHKLEKISTLLVSCSCDMSVGIENGYDEVNVQIPATYKYVFSQQIMFDQENVATYVPKIKFREQFCLDQT